MVWAYPDVNDCIGGTLKNEPSRYSRKVGDPDSFTGTSGMKVEAEVAVEFILPTLVSTI